MRPLCILRCLGNTHEPINLGHLKRHIIGRSKETKIKDRRCSKSQVQLVADCEKCIVTVKQLGPNTSATNGIPLKCGNTAEVKHGGILELLLGQYPHKIEFDPAPTNFEVTLKKEDETEFRKPSSEWNCFISGGQSSNISDTDKVKSDSGDDGSSKKRKNENKDYSFKLETKKFKLEVTGFGNWDHIEGQDLLIYNKDGVEPKSKIASYDMDGTLIVTQSGRVFAVDYNDWKIAYTQVPGKLKQLNSDGYKLVIFSNQAGIGIGKHSVEGVEQKIANIIQKLGVPFQVFVATGKTKYRKPLPDVWNYMVENCNGGVKVDLSKSVYVGDAAGRPEVKKVKRKDFSCSDRLFALNVGIPFQTPEEHFQGVKQQPHSLPEFDPRKIDTEAPLFDPVDTKVPKYPVEVVILVGYPGSGKSFFFEAHLSKLGYVQVNRDMLGSWQKCLAVMKRAIEEGKSVVIDNTNPDKESRQRYIDIAKTKMVPARCFKFNVSKAHALHNNKFREYLGSDHSKVNEMVFNMYKSKYQEPDLLEGFDEIVKVNFVPKFKTQEEKRIYKMFLLEK